MSLERTSGGGWRSFNKQTGARQKSRQVEGNDTMGTREEEKGEGQNEFKRTEKSIPRVLSPHAEGIRIPVAKIVLKEDERAWRDADGKITDGPGEWSIREKLKRMEGSKASLKRRKPRWGVLLSVAENNKKKKKKKFDYIWRVSQERGIHHRIQRRGSRGENSAALESNYKKSAVVIGLGGRTMACLFQKGDYRRKERIRSNRD